MFRIFILLNIEKPFKFLFLTHLLYAKNLLAIQIFPKHDCNTKMGYSRKTTEMGNPILLHFHENPLKWVTHYYFIFFALLGKLMNKV